MRRDSCVAGDPVSRLAACLLFLALLIPSTWNAWVNRDMPNLGKLHDDTLYIMAGKTIADGLGPKIASLPGEPAQTKYPPGLPFLVSLVWRWNPDLATIRPWLTLLAWSFVPMLLGGVLVLYRRWGLSDTMRWSLVAFLALSCYTALLGTMVISEVLFTALLVAALIALDDERWVLAGVLAGLACLTRTTGVVMLVAIPAAVWLQRRSFRPGLVFSAAMLPFVAGWAVWTRLFRSSGSDRITAYYTDYVAEIVWNATRSNYPTMLWKNADAWMAGVAEVLVPDSGYTVLSHAILSGLALFSVIGSWRLCRVYPRAIPYSVTSLLMSAMVVAWCYPPTERLIFPAFPLLLAGLGIEVANFGRALRASWAKQPVATALTGAVVGAGLVFAIGQHATFWSSHLPGYYRSFREITRDNNSCFARIAAELPADAAFVAHHDPLLWLRTGRHGVRMMYRTADWYEDRPDNILATYMDTVGFARQHGLGYVLQNRRFRGDLSEEQFVKYWRMLETNPELEPVFTCGETRVWRVLPQPSPHSQEPSLRTQAATIPR